MTLPTTECVEWPGPKFRGGYGRFGPQRAHRVSYEWEYGPIPDGLQIDHLCRNRACILPEHLEAVSAGENLRRSLMPLIRALDRAMPNCPRGHAYDEANTYTHNGCRRCRKCAAIFQKERRVRNREHRII